MSVKKVLTAVVFASMACVSAQAAEVYVGGNLGASRWNADDEPGTTIDKTSTGGKVVVGVQMHPNFALEGGYAQLGKAAYTGAFTGDIKGTGWFVDAVGMLPMSPEWSGLVRLGAFRGKAKGTVTGLGSASDSGTDLKYGLGVQYMVSKTLAVRGEWERYRFDVFDDKGDVDLWSVGVKVSF